MAHPIHILSAATVAVGALVGAPSTTRAGVTATEASACGGSVFRDLDGDGRRVEILERDARADDVEPGVGGVSISVVDVDGRSHTTTSRRDGDWSIDLRPDEYPIRIEFGVPAGYEVGRPGPDAGTRIQYVPTPGHCDGSPLGNLGMFPIGEFCATVPEIAISCHVPGVAASWESQPAITAVSNNVVDDGRAVEPGRAGATAFEGWLHPSTRTIATHGEVGTVYGQAARRDGTLFAAAFTKRHTRSASALNPDGNPTVIYRIPNGGAAEVFVTLDPSAVDPHGRQDRLRVADDLEVMDAVFTTGIGDIELSPDETTLYAVELGRRELVAIDVASATVIERRRLDGPALGRTDCSVTATDRFGDLRPFGLGWAADELLVGVVCSAASTADIDRMVRERGDAGPGAGDHDQLVGYVYRLRSGALTEVLAWPLAADRGETHSSGLLSNEAIWHPWTSTYPFDAEHRAVSYPQPAVTDLVVDASGHLIIAIGDRWAHQTAPETDAPSRDGSTRRITETVAAGDLQRACRRAGGWVIEGTVGCPGGFGNGWEFFDGESYGWQAETALGSVARLPGRSEVVATQMNPVPEDHAWSSGGLVWHDTDDGDRSTGVRLYDRRAAPPASTFENASGLGDLAVLCGGPAPSIGGAVWHDTDADGVRAPGDRAVAGAVIELVGGDGEVLAIDDADGRGRYSFDESNVPNGLVRGERYLLVLAERNYRPGRGVLVGLGDHTGLVPTTRAGSVIEVTAGDDPRTVEREPVNDHHHDFGLRDRYDLAVTTSAGPAMSQSGMIAFRIEVRNEGSLPSGAFELRANLPAATSLRPSRVLSTRPTTIGDGSVSWAFDESAEIAPGDVRTIDMELRVNDPSVESIEHSVGIVRDSGRDEDSEPGVSWGEDDEDELVVDLYGIAGTISVDEATEETERLTAGAGGVVVHVLAEDGAQVGGTTTDESGRFLFHSFPAGVYRIAIPAGEFESGRPLHGHDRATGASSGNVTRMLDREGSVTTDPIELGRGGAPRTPPVDVGLVRRPPTALVDLVVPMVLLPAVLLCVGLLALDRRRHLGGTFRPANRM